MNIKDHNDLFKGEEYAKQFEAKKEFEMPCTSDEVQQVAEYTKTKEYMEKNLAREALTVNPAKSCQPLGAMFAALGFEGTLPFVQGSQGCVAYFRSHLSRHFKEPVAAVSSSMTEDAAVFGGLSNMLEGLENANTLYKPKALAVCTTCMAEVIGDDLSAYIRTAREKNAIPEDLPVPFAHTPSFVGSHITGYDVMMKGLLTALVPSAEKEPSEKINIIPGFETYTGNIRELKRMMSSMGVECTVLSDISEVMDSPNDGEYTMYPGGTSLEETRQALNAKATFSLMPSCTPKTAQHIKQEWVQEVISGPYPMGIENTDKFLAEVSRVTGKPVSEELEAERGRAVDAMVDSHPYIHGKKFALVGDPDMIKGLVSFIMELGGMPVHIVSTTGSSKKFEQQVMELLSKSPFGSLGKVYPGKDMWHLRSLMFNEPVDILLGNSYAKFLWRDTKTPLVRVGFPLIDRHHMHRMPIIGYQGGLNLTTLMVNTVLEEMDRKALDGPSFDVIR
jgi:nitrogenase molybdenum-iron protein beta chain